MDYSRLTNLERRNVGIPAACLVPDPGVFAVSYWSRRTVKHAPGVLKGMPEISRFFGVIVRMFYNDHQPPHFHAVYGEHEALIEIETLDIYRGELPRRAFGLVLEWAVLHRPELRRNWDLARSGRTPEPIAPLE